MMSGATRCQRPIWSRSGRADKVPVCWVQKKVRKPCRSGRVLFVEGVTGTERIKPPNPIPTRSKETAVTYPTTTPTTHSPTGRHECSPVDRVTKSLLGYGVIAGPIYVTVSLAEAFTREGFDVSRHAWSLLANGRHGWIQIANLIGCGLMLIAFAVGLRRALTPGAGASWAPRLFAVYGLSLVTAGMFRADPALGFPVGTPQAPTAVSWHGMVHFLAGAIGFTALAVACFVLAHCYATEHRDGWAWFSGFTGVLFLAGFAMLAAGGGSQVPTVAFIVAVVLVSAWITAVAVDRYRRVADAARSDALPRA